MQKVECFLLHLKEIYPSLRKPSSSTIDDWKTILDQLSVEDIVNTLKHWVNLNPKTPPTPKQFSASLVKKNTKKTNKRTFLPFNPETYLFNEDIKKQRNKHFFSTYRRAVNYILNVRLKEFYPKEEFKNFNYSARYERAVEKGLFADFADVLDYVSESRECYD
ncbi:MAG: hypothetical protein IKW39_04625 [Alphaproteobacteria bacterium]|nr:hypothetical protein [Alphaproteobacteria bacterium]